MALFWKDLIEHKRRKNAIVNLIEDFALRASNPFIHLSLCDLKLVSGKEAGRETACASERRRHKKGVPDMCDHAPA